MQKTSFVDFSRSWTDHGRLFLTSSMFGLEIFPHSWLLAIAARLASKINWTFILFTFFHFVTTQNLLEAEKEDTEQKNSARVCFIECLRLKNKTTHSNTGLWFYVRGNYLAFMSLVTQTQNDWLFEIIFMFLYSRISSLSIKNAILFMASS